ncbi:inactive serine/threonine-protein kinase TEX14 isoform X2 [Xenopus laevis]|uniref:Inactive serine/threonine-protein kinase TEX14 isoform X2 n=1 Tax=Xenopus laevis TaxID=8355 RepID=A0A8J1M8Z6_XENLA|nr:inactive serine/threonine-protein kinase TEX14 isoform X2 [Xenopus laevis]
MSHSIRLLQPCPVRIGSIKYDSDEKQLHEDVKYGCYTKVKQMLKKGISADSINSLGQTPLFIAALLGHSKMVDLLLRYGSNPNHRCFDWSTPVHAAAFSGNQWILSMLIDAGGDLRLHDQDCRKPYCWALLAGRHNNAQMIEFIDRCTAHMQALVQCFPYKALKKVDSSSILIHNSSLMDLLSQGNAEKYGGVSTKTISSFGYGKLYFTDDSYLSCMAYIPYVEERDLVQGNDKPVFSFSAGQYMTMTNKLHHPHILQLLAVCVSPDLEKTRLVFERVISGTLYSILHERRTDFPILDMETILNIFLQVIDALIFVHWRGFIHCAFSSHAINIILPGLAKLSNFEYMAESKDGKVHTDVSHFPVPPYLYRWSAPEVIMGKTISTKSDLFSFCVVMQEVLTDTLPWDGLDGLTVKNAVVSGQNLAVDLRIAKPYDKIVSTGIQAMAKDRAISLQDIRWMLKKDIEDFLESRKSTSETLGTECQNLYPNVNNLFQPRRSLSKEPHKLQTDTLDHKKTFGDEETEIHCNCRPIVTWHLDSENPNKQTLHTEADQSVLVSDFAQDDQNKDTISCVQVNAFSKRTDVDYQLENQKTKPQMGKNTYNLESHAEEKHVVYHQVITENSSSETDSESNTEEIYSLCEIVDPVKDTQIGETVRSNRASSLQKHISSITDKLAISNLLEKLNEALNSVENALKKSDNTHMQTYKKQKAEECVTCKISDEISRDEVDDMCGALKMKSNAVWSAVEPPSQYKPPRLSHMYTQSDKKNVQSEYAMGARLKTVKNELSCKDYCSPQTTCDGGQDTRKKTHRMYAEDNLKFSNIEVNKKRSKKYREILFGAKANVLQGRTENVGRTTGMASSEWSSARDHSTEPCTLRNVIPEHTTASDILRTDLRVGLDKSLNCTEDEFFTAKFELSCCSNDQYPELESVREEINVTQSTSNLIMCPSGRYKQAELGSDQLEMATVGVNKLSFIHHTSSFVDIQELSTINLPTPRAGKISTRISTPIAAVLDSSVLDTAENNTTRNNYKRIYLENKGINKGTTSSNNDTDRAHGTLDDALERIMHSEAMDTEVTDRAHSTLDEALERIMHSQAKETEVTDRMSSLDKDGP